MTGNKSYLTDYKEIDGGFVAFGGNSKRGKINGKGKIRTGKLDFEDMYFAKELKFNLFSVSQMYEKKNSVLFTDTACIVLSQDFKLTDESHVLLKVPRKDNTYNVDLKNVVFSKSGTEFKNRVMNQFCEMKGIKREFSVARTPQQNGVAEKKNRTLIKAARTMLADSKLPITFWAEAVNNACYVQNRVSVIKPHNKTPYELFLGKTRVETVPNKDYILLPLWTQEPLFSYSSKDFPGAGHKPSGEEEKKNIEDPGNEDSEATIIEEPRFNQENESVNSTNRVNAVISTVNAASNEVNVVGRKLSIELLYDPNMPELEDISIFEDSNEDTASTLMETHKTLLKDEKGEDVDEHLYRSMIGLLMYLTSSRPDIMFVVCAYARFQVNPKILHLRAVKRIFRYLKGQPNRLMILCHHPHAHDLESLLTISPSKYALLLDRFDNNVSFEEEVVHQRLRKTLTHVLKLSSCIYLDDRALGGVLNFDSAGVRAFVTGFPAQSISSSNTVALDSPNLLVLNTGASQSRQQEESSKKAEESNLKRARDELEQESTKKQKVDDDQEAAELKRCLEIVADDEDDVTIDTTPLSSKSLTIIDYKIQKEGRKSYFQIIRGDGSS
nr:ribonuclease H-like domain-containing protein [Tanacetum cinerariifolium]